jgi:anti-sigma B factor antagonist
VIKLIKVIEPAGILERESVAQLQQTILEQIKTADGILVDLRQVNFMNSAGLGGLARVYNDLRKLEKELFLCSLSDQVRIIFELTTMDSCFQIFPNREAFEQAMRQLSSPLTVESI